MTKSTSARRMAQNEVAFKEANKRVTDGFDELEAIAKEDGVTQLFVDPDMTLMFLCECSDENCTKRIEVTLGEYNRIHQSSKCFVMADRHDVPEIESVVIKEPNYIVVQKYEEPPQDVEELVETEVNNKRK
ncbi:MAG: hypothetical protein JWO54_428 [Candidatus Saccharibacteria bacterium]|nr:hypothetical protein [Candidatus Saccharibacteria bacterium]MDB5180668.1 hypothetical protein [Candidatus Saccharibacteria bacterium]